MFIIWQQSLGDPQRRGHAVRVQGRQSSGLGSCQRSFLEMVVLCSAVSLRDWQDSLNPALRVVLWKIQKNTSCPRLWGPLGPLGRRKSSGVQTLLSKYFLNSITDGPISTSNPTPPRKNSPSPKPVAFPILTVPGNDTVDYSVTAAEIGRSSWTPPSPLSPSKCWLLIRPP